MQEQELKDLLMRYQAGKATDEEKAFLENWYLQYRPNEQGDYALEDRLADAEAIWDDLQSVTKEAKRISIWPRIAAAASILLFLSIGGYFVLHKQQAQQTAQNQIHDISPGRNQATLTLANGQKIILTKGLNGKLAQQGNTSIAATAGQSIVYTAGNTDQVAPVQYNTVSTTRGQESPLPVVLADGTKVWLNAASSIVFPTAFNGKDRVVKITGEVCFEVRHNAAQPFKVETRGQTIEDIGTTFNINAYDDEATIRTTLLQGSVKVSNSGSSVILKPGQQAVIQPGNASIKVKDADVSEAFAWKDGMFRFNSESLESILRNVSRWYDVDIEYADNSVKELPFGAVSTRFTNVSQVLKMLEMSKEVHFKIEGKKIIVMK